MTTYVISFVGTIFIYLLCRKLYAKRPLLFLHPTLTSFVVLVTMLSLSHIPYVKYAYGTRWLEDLLGPAIVSFAIPLYRNLDILKRHALEIFTCLLTGSVVAMTTSVLFARLLHLNHAIDLSLAPRSVTTPIAMEISRTLGGSPSLTAGFTLITGLSGAIVGPLLIRWFQIRSAMAKGMLLGMGCHGLGTSIAFDIGQLEGTFASLSMMTAAGITVGLAPVLVHVIV